MGTKGLIESVCVEFIPGSLENKMPLNWVAITYLNASEAELDYSYLIRNILLMQWNLKVQVTPNYFLEMALYVYVLIGHSDLLGDLADKD